MYYHILMSQSILLQHLSRSTFGIGASSFQGESYLPNLAIALDSKQTFENSPCLYSHKPPSNQPMDEYPHSIIPRLSVHCLLLPASCRFLSVSCLTCAEVCDISASAFSLALISSFSYELERPPMKLRMLAQKSLRKCTPEMTSLQTTHFSTSVTLNDLLNRPLSPSPPPFMSFIAVAIASLSLTPLIFRTVFSSQSVTTFTMYR